MTTIHDPQPLRIARTAAGLAWPDIQAEWEITDGVFGFACAGHGGLVAVLGVADLPDYAIRVARQLHMVTAVPTVDLPRPGAVWLGEEDGAWAQLALVSDKIREGLATSGYHGVPTSREECFRFCRHSHERFVAALYPGYQPLPDGQIERAARRAAKLANDEVMLASAQSAPNGMVLVLFSNPNRREYWLTTKQEYGQRAELPYEPTPDDFRAAGITLLPSDREEPDNA